MYNRLLAQGKIKKEDICPEIGPFVFYWDAFQELSSCRLGSMGLTPIPFTAIVDYANIYEVDNFSEFIEIIRIMDAELLKIDSEKQAARNNSNGGKTGSRNSNKGR